MASSYPIIQQHTHFRRGRQSRIRPRSYVSVTRAEDRVLQCLTSLLLVIARPGTDRSRVAACPGVAGALVSGCDATETGTAGGCSAATGANLTRFFEEPSRVRS